MYYYLHINGNIIPNTDLVVNAEGGPDRRFDSPMVKKWWHLDDKLKRGTQVAYIPQHAKFDIKHSDVEFGFITSGPNKEGDYFCRYFIKGKEGKVLRTAANSELTPGDMITVLTLGSLNWQEPKLISEFIETFC